jgi:hypothetical protein
MASGAESDEILFMVVTEVVPSFDVMDLQINLPSTGLAAPPVASQDLLTQLPAHAVLSDGTVRPRRSLFRRLLSDWNYNVVVDWISYFATAG